MKVTAKKIAEIAGVSRGTVDRALHGREGINKEVEKRILQIAQELDYKPNIVGKALSQRSGGRQKIGVLLNSEGNPFFNEVIRGIQSAGKEIEDFGVQIILKTLKGYQEQNFLNALEELVDQKIQGIALTPINTPAITQQLNELAKTIPMVTINNDINGVDRLAYVGCDYFRSGKTAAEMLGHFTGGSANVGIIVGSNMILGHRQRAVGFYEVMAQEFPKIKIVEEVQNDDSDPVSEAVVQKLLTEHPEVNALYFTAGGIVGGIKAIRKLGKEKKLHIVTCDLTPIVLEGIHSGLIDATICQEPYRQGFESIKILFDFLMASRRPQKQFIYTDIEIRIRHNTL